MAEELLSTVRLKVATTKAKQIEGFFIVERKNVSCSQCAFRDIAGTFL